jgi:hypothetical protein
VRQLDSHSEVDYRVVYPFHWSENDWTVSMKPSDDGWHWRAILLAQVKSQVIGTDANLYTAAKVILRDIGVH